jgi:hypothetical protein
MRLSTFCARPLHNKKQFFFEKKNQKTFVCFGRHLCYSCGSAATSNSQKFFVSFFQKRNTSLLLLPPSSTLALEHPAGIFARERADFFQRLKFGIAEFYVHGGDVVV